MNSIQMQPIPNIPNDNDAEEWRFRTNTSENIFLSQMCRY